MAIVGTVIETVGDNTDSTSYQTGANTPTNGESQLFGVYTRKIGGGDTPTVTGCGSTWTERANVTDGAGRCTVFESYSTAYSSGALTIATTATQTGCIWGWSEYEGGNSTAFIVQSGSTFGTGVTTFTVNLSTFASTGNATYGFFGYRGINRAPAQGAGFTLLGTTEHSAPNSGAIHEWRADPDTSVTATVDTAEEWTGVAFELAAAEAAESKTGTDTAALADTGSVSAREETFTALEIITNFT